MRWPTAWWRGIREERFWLLSEDELWRGICNTRLDDIRDAREPTLAVPTDVVEG